MEFLVLWIATIIGSIFMDLATGLLIFKDLADEGYKMYLENIHEFNEVNSLIKKRLYITYLIPFFNILESFNRTINYDFAREIIIDEIRVTVGIEEMTNEEKEAYQKNPTRLNALLIPIKTKIKERDENSAICSVKSNDYEISFKFGETINDITIIKVTGTATELSEEEQKKLIIDDLRKSVLAGIEKYGNIDNFVEAVKKSSDENKTLSLNDEQKESISINEQKQNLENLRNEIIESKKNTENKENIQILTKKPNK